MGCRGDSPTWPPSWYRPGWRSSTPRTPPRPTPPDKRPQPSPPRWRDAGSQAGGRGGSEAGGYPTVLLRVLVPAGPEVLRSGPCVAVEPLERIRLQQCVATARLEQAVNRPNAQL